MTPAHEEGFYKRQYGGGINALDGFDASAGAVFAPGQRYHLAYEKISLRAKPDDLLVELGTGNGKYLLYLCNKLGIRRAVGIDIAFESPSDHSGVRFFNHNLNEDWPFESGSVDHLIAMMVFEHLFDPFHTFSEVARTLSPSGRAYVNLPLVTALPNRLRLLSGKVPVTSVSEDRWFSERHWDGNHLHYYSVDLIKKLAKLTGLEVGDMRGVGRFYRLKSAFPSLLAGELTFSLTRL
jgi:SAM-dependent methyltransferase